MKYANISTKEEFKAFMLDADAADMWDEMDPEEWKSACEYAGIDYNDYDDPDKPWLDLEKKYVIDNVVMTFEGLNMTSRQMDELFRDSFLDLPVLYKVPINEDESSFIVVSMHNLVTFGIDEDELREAAKRNTFSKTKVVIDLKNGIAASMCEGISGAVIMTSKDSMRNLSERFYCGGGFYIIPLSIYEIITAPVREDTDDERSNLLEILKEGNKTLVEKEEILSYSLYRYYSDDEEVKIEC